MTTLTWFNGSQWNDGLIRGNNSYVYTEEVEIDYEYGDGYKESISFHFDDGMLKMYIKEYWPTYEILKIYFIAEFDCWCDKFMVYEYAEYVANSYLKNRSFIAVPNVEYQEEHCFENK
jgi:hypothetical protein